MDEAQAGYYAVVVLEELQPDERSLWTAFHPQLPGCHAVGRNEEEARENLEPSRRAWLDTATLHKMRVPDPSPQPSITIQYALRRKSQKAQGASTEVEVFELSGT